MLKASLMSVIREADGQASGGNDFGSDDWIFTIREKDPKKLQNGEGQSGATEQVRHESSFDIFQALIVFLHPATSTPSAEAAPLKFLSCFSICCRRKTFQRGLIHRAWAPSSLLR